MKGFKALIGALVLLPVGGVAIAEAAQITVSCSKIADPTARLACFDKAFPNPDAQPMNGSVPSTALQTQPLGTPASGQAAGSPNSRADNAGMRSG